MAPQTSLDILIAGILTALVCSAAFIDVRSRRIPNLIVYPGIPLMLALHYFFGPPGALTGSALGLAVPLAIFMAPYAMGWIGAGDVKLFSLVGAGLGVNAVPTVVLFSSLAGGVYTIWAVHRRLLVEDEDGSSRNGFLRLIFGSGKKPKICYGIAIASGTLAAIAWKGLGYGYLFSWYVG